MWRQAGQFSLQLVQDAIPVVGVSYSRAGAELVSIADLSIDWTESWHRRGAKWRPLLHPGSRSEPRGGCAAGDACREGGSDGLSEGS